MGVPSSVFVDLTREFNAGRVRAVVCSGQAVVLHRLAIMSKDGDWILREDEEALRHVLAVLARRGARYRFGAPLDLRWLSGGWSSHFQFLGDGIRVRTDFFTRPPRIAAPDLVAVWREAEKQEVPVVALQPLADMKKTDRERDYAVIGELARRMTDPRDQVRYSRSARDLLVLADEHPRLVAELVSERPVLRAIPGGREELERALDAERRALMRANEERLERYREAALRWAEAWPGLERELADLALTRAHERVVERALGLLPFTPSGEAKP